MNDFTFNFSKFIEWEAQHSSHLQDSSVWRFGEDIELCENAREGRMSGTHIKTTMIDFFASQD